MAVEPDCAMAVVANTLKAAARMMDFMGFLQCKAVGPGKGLLRL
jgi:hypothetical protein